MRNLDAQPGVAVTAEEVDHTHQSRLVLVGVQPQATVGDAAAAFDMRILVNQPRLTPELALTSGVEATDLIDLLAASDFISLHVPFTEETDAIIGAAELGTTVSLDLLSGTSCRS